jgi:hypothetical protein
MTREKADRRKKPAAVETRLTMPLAREEVNY